jgi:hypothetical protein
MVSFKSHDILSNGRNAFKCAICLEEARQSTAFRLPCKHSFHAECLAAWLRKAKSATCPLCRYSLYYAHCGCRFQLRRITGGREVTIRQLSGCCCDAQPARRGLLGWGDWRDYLVFLLVSILLGILEGFFLQWLIGHIAMLELLKNDGPFFCVVVMCTAASHFAVFKVLQWLARQDEVV